MPTKLTAPKLKARIKVHKQEYPIRPVVNNINSPTHDIARYFNKILLNLIELPYTYNVSNSSTLAMDLTKLRITPQHKCITLDVKDLYVNIPIKEILDIVNKHLRRNNIDKQTTEQCIGLLGVILNNSYFTFNNKYYTNNKGIAMGSPISGTIAEIFLQHYEQLYVKHLIERQSIKYYTRYVDDIFIIFDSTKITEDEITASTTGIHKNIELMQNLETNEQIEHLDLLISRQADHLETDIYRKPTTADLTIQATSNHPIEHKLAAYRYHLHRMHTLPLTENKKMMELNIIKTMARKNGYTEKIVDDLNRNLIHNIQRNKNEENKQKKRVTVSYTSPYIRRLTNIFHNTNVQIVFKPINKLGNYLKNYHNTLTELKISGIYELRYQICKRTYVSQTSRDLHTRYKEHTRYIKNN